MAAIGNAGCFSKSCITFHSVPFYKPTNVDRELRAEIAIVVRLWFMAFYLFFALVVTNSISMCLIFL